MTYVVAVTRWSQPPHTQAQFLAQLLFSLHSLAELGPDLVDQCRQLSLGVLSGFLGLRLRIFLSCTSWPASQYNEAG